MEEIPGVKIARDAMIGEVKASLERLPKTIYRRQTCTCGRPDTEYDPCRCNNVFYDPNPEYERLKGLLAKLIRERYCDACNLIVTPAHSFCGGCGKKYSMEASVHGACVHWDPLIPYCGSCGKPSVE